MPLYELQCRKCKRIFEVTMTLDDKDKYEKGLIYNKCPVCKYKLIPIISKPMFKISV